MRLPPDVWIDLEYAVQFDRRGRRRPARAGDARRAWSHAVALVIIARRPFLPGEEASLDRSAARPGSVRCSFAGCTFSRISRQQRRARPGGAICDLRSSSSNRFRRPATAHLMQMHAEMGNRGEALRVFGQVPRVVQGGARRGSLRRRPSACSSKFSRAGGSRLSPATAAAIRRSPA